MAIVNLPRVSLSDRASQIHSITPFYSRNYGGFTKEQWAFFRKHAGSLKNKIVLDPMAGQAYYLSQLALEGASVHAGDINPATVLLATLRDPRIIVQAEGLTKWMVNRLDALKRLSSADKLHHYCDDWIAPGIRQQLNKYASAFGLDQTWPLISAKSTFWDSPIKQRFAAAIPILAARELTCFRSSDNFTWLKKGGLLREQSVHGALLRALNRWLVFAREIRTSCSLERTSPGYVDGEWMDAERGFFGSSPKAHVIVTSPAYANRLDYTRMWAPELEITAALFHVVPTEIKALQIGSTVIRGKEEPAKEREQLPRTVQLSLAEIRADVSNVASESYYYPFFVNYAVSLMRTVKHISKRARRGGRLVFFVRDTVRKDTLFPTGNLIEEVLFREGWVVANREKTLVRSHIGMRRRASRGGVYGLAQTEWWLTFERRKW
jgi:hypothetical protein